MVWVRRTTLWETSRGELLQVSVAVLDDAWDPQSEITTAVGPFDDPGQAVATTTEAAEQAAWWCTRQQRLPI
jgi:hypothetical protein